MIWMEDGGDQLYYLEVTILTTAVGSGGEEMGGMRNGSSVPLCNNQQEDPTSSKCINIFVEGGVLISI